MCTHPSTKETVVEQFFQQYGIFIIPGLVLIGLMWWSSTQRKRMEAERLKREEELFTSLVPGTWVRTVFGFWGRYVDTDGEVVILETADGTEMYWEKKTIQEVGTPPFASESHEDYTEEEDLEDDEDDETILGFEGPDTEQKN